VTLPVEVYRFYAGQNALLGKDFLNPPHFPVCQSNFDTVGVAGGFGEDVPDDTPGQDPGSLIHFQDDIHFYSGFDISAVYSVHCADPHVNCVHWRRSGGFTLFL
jgi:hypothetical protein